jgi:hypothetical protein
MTHAQIELQNALTTTFLANLAFLSEYDKELYYRVDELSRMIENGAYQEKYALDFIMENGEFDIYDIVNDKYLYKKNPKKMNDDMVKKVEFNEKNAIFDLPEYFVFGKPERVDKSKRFDYKNVSECILATRNDTFEYSNTINDFLENRKKRLKKVRKFIFLGTLLGRHIPRIAQKVDADMYLVLERNLEIFRLSLFTVDYTILANKGAIFSIMDDSLEEEKKISEFITTEGLNNYLIKLSSTGININEYIDNLLSMLHSVRPTAYDYIRMLYIHANRTTKVLNNKYRVLILNKIKENCEVFNDIPILYLAAGPSLDENIEWIKTNQDKFFIVTIGAAYKKLLANNIKIDIITTLDESDILEKLQFDDESVSKISKDTIILASVMTNEKILKKFNQKNLFLFEIFTPFHLNNIVYDGFSIGEIVLAILMSLNPKQIYLIGLDLALNQTTGASHSKASNSVTQVLNLEQEQRRDIFVVDESLIKVKGNLEKEVFTTPFFYSSIKSAEAKISKKSENTTIYNLSTHGAYFEGSIPQKIEDINVNDFDNFTPINNDFISYLKKNSLNKLGKKSQKEFTKEISFLNSEIRDILNEIKNQEFKTYDEFYEKILIISTKIYGNKLSIFYQVIVNYYQLIIPYLSYHFNDVKIKNEKKKVKKIKEIFIKQIEVVLDDYILCLERVI